MDPRRDVSTTMSPAAGRLRIQLIFDDQGSLAMLGAMAPGSCSKLDGWQRGDVVYGSVSDPELLATVLTLETKLERSVELLPVLVSWRGGGFITEHSRYEQ